MTDRSLRSPFIVVLISAALSLSSVWCCCMGAEAATFRSAEAHAVAPQDGGVTHDHDHNSPSSGHSHDQCPDGSFVSLIVADTVAFKAPLLVARDSKCVAVFPISSALSSAHIAVRTTVYVHSPPVVLPTPVAQHIKLLC